MARLAGFFKCDGCKKLHASGPMSKCPQCGHDILRQAWSVLPGATARDRRELRNGEGF